MIIDEVADSYLGGFGGTAASLACSPPGSCRPDDKRGGVALVSEVSHLFMRPRITTCFWPVS